MIQKNLTVLIILYQENIDVVKKCLDQLKKFKVIIIDNANDANLKNKLTEDYNIHKETRTQKATRNLGYLNRKGKYLYDSGFKSCPYTLIPFIAKGIANGPIPHIIAHTTSFA